MSQPLRPELDLNLPDGRGVNFPPPVLPLDAYCDWLQEQHEERARQGSFDRYLADPFRCPVDAPFRLD
jgi:hypothetical protein